MTRPHPIVIAAFALILAAILWQLAGPMLDLVRLYWWRIEHLN